MVPSLTTNGENRINALAAHLRKFDSFPLAIEFVDRLAEAAERANHHPDIDIRYRKVTVRWTTHSKGGITDKDREMAELTATLEHSDADD